MCNKMVSARIIKSHCYISTNIVYACMVAGSVCKLV